jgi:hypothetical protein
MKFRGNIRHLNSNQKNCLVAKYHLLTNFLPRGAPDKVWNSFIAKTQSNCASLGRVLLLRRMNPLRGNPPGGTVPFSAAAAHCDK